MSKKGTQLWQTKANENVARTHYKCPCNKPCKSEPPVHGFPRTAADCIGSSLTSPKLHSATLNSGPPKTNPVKTAFQSWSIGVQIHLWPLVHMASFLQGYFCQRFTRLWKTKHLQKYSKIYVSLACYRQIDRNPPITATSATFRPSLCHASRLWLVDFNPIGR